MPPATWLGRFTRGIAAGCIALLAADAARAVELLDGRLQLHGYFEAQLRAIANDFDTSDGLDLTQWYNVLDLEVDFEIAPDGFGPFDRVSSFARIEARYDCVWTRACGLFRSADAFGDRSRHLPRRYSNARRTGVTGATFTGDTRPIHGVPVDRLGFAFKDESFGDRHQPAYLWHFPGVATLFGVPGSDGVVGTADDPAFFAFERFVRPGREYRFALRQVRGASNGSDLQALGPWLPRNRIDPTAALADRPNPFNALDFNPIAGPMGSFGSTELPYRRAPNVPASFDSPSGDPAQPRGMFVPNEAVARLLRKGAFGDFDQNFRQQELAWNRGASQQDEKELKELYLDLELLESRLWLRLGKQNIVWGKTELFRTTDQFNPQDIALASLASFEESRVALWAARGVYSLYSVGPLEDVRLELAFNFDQVEPADLGRCGEPYSPNPVCNKSSGLFAHGLAGFGLAGEVRPEPPWEDVRGFELGARVEFRWDRFSFALSDFWGYDDYPYLDTLFLYERNVDPRTGRPRRAGARAGCDPDALFDGDTTGCLAAGDDALLHHSANLQRFAIICAASVGFSDLDRSVCAQSVFNSDAIANGTVRVVTALGALLGGTAIGANVLAGLAGISVPQASSFLARLDQDPQDCLAAFDCGNLIPGAADPIGDGFVDLFLLGAVENFLTNEQEALLGCGPFYGTRCSTPGGGLDLLNAEMSALLQAWPGFPGSFGDWDATSAAMAQPGTLGFAGGPVCTRFASGGVGMLPGCRGAADAGYDPNVDGSATGRTHPLTAQPWANEMAAVSWNFLATLVTLSGLGKPEAERLIDEFLPSQPLRSDGCSFSRPQLCSNVQAIYAVAHTRRKTLRAGGNGEFGRVDFEWHVAGTGALRYDKRNVLGFAMDFAEDATKTNWGFESTWVAGVPFADHDRLDGLRRVDVYNLTVSVDRPTFVNFLNANRTFFLNSQWFFQYVDGYRRSFPSNGPLNVLATFTVETGYLQDRLLPSVTFVYDFESASGAALPQVEYRFRENFSATVGLAFFSGRFQGKTPPLGGVGDPPFRVGRGRNRDYVEEGLSPIRDRDEVFLRVRYTF